MNYIGSKHTLLGFIKNTIYSTVGQDLSHKVFCDIFAGTGIVGRSFKKEVRTIIANDIEYYSYVLNKNYISNHQPIPNKEDYIQKLDSLRPYEGFIYQNYCLGGKSDRQYFSDENGKKIDASRVQIEDWLNRREINENLYFFLLASLLESADKVANTASVYGAYLKHLKKSAEKSLILIPAEFELSANQQFVYNQDSNILIHKIEGDILTIDNSFEYQRKDTLGYPDCQ